MKCPLSERAQNVLWAEELNLDIYVLEVAAWYGAALAELKSGQHRVEQQVNRVKADRGY